MDALGPTKADYKGLLIIYQGVQVSLCTKGLFWDINYKCVDYSGVLIFKCPH